MRTSVAAAGALLTVCIAASGPFGAGPAAPNLPARTAGTHAPPACREAAWPYVPAACMPQAGLRQVRLLPAEAGRRP
jgi:hypothetical protein